MIVLNAVLFAAAAFLASFVVVGVAWALARGRAAAARHLVWTGAFAALLALPVAALVLPSQMTFLLAAPSAVPAAPVPVVAAAPAPGFGLVNAIVVIAALWLAGVAFHLLRLAIAGLGVIRLYRRSVAHIPHGIDGTPFRGLGWQLRLRTTPGGDAGPLTWGVLRPIVLLPKASVTWPRERLMSVLLHEAAHVRRKDCLCRLIAIAACALYWPNPLVWLAARAMRRDAESAADDCVLTAGVRPTCYAEHLVGLAREFSGKGLAMTLSMAERRMLDTRVKAILDPAQPRSGVTKMDVLKLGVAALALTAGLALVRPSLAETPAPIQNNDGAHRVQIQADEIVFDKSATKGPVKTLMIHAQADTSHPGRVIVHVADAGDMPAPPAPPAADGAPIPPVPPIAPVPPVPAVEAIPPVPPVHAFRDGERQGQAEARRAMAEARRALAEVDIHQTVRAAMQQAEQALRQAKINQQQAEKAVAAIDVDRIVAQAMKRAEAALQRAEVAQSRAERQRAIIERRIQNDNGDVTDETTQSEE